MGKPVSRRSLLKAGIGLAAGVAMGGIRVEAQAKAKRGAQRLSVEQLRKWESLEYGMFIHFGMSTFLGAEKPDGTAPATAYSPDGLSTDQWMSVARDVGMKYAVLTAKHVAGHCLWPSDQTDYTVANSGDKTDVVAAFVKSCEKRGIKPGLYYCSWDNHTKLESNMWGSGRPGKPFTTSLYHDYVTSQITELLTRYGPIAEMWIDIPGLLGRGYRTFLYRHISELQPETVVMMNSGISDQKDYNINYAWPSDLIAIERRLPPEGGHAKWRTIEGKEYYVPGEVCDYLGHSWFYEEGDAPQPDADLLNLAEGCRAGGANLLLNVPPNKHGLIPAESIQALDRLRRAQKL